MTDSMLKSQLSSRLNCSYLFDWINQENLQLDQFICELAFWDGAKFDFEILDVLINKVEIWNSGKAEQKNY